jgi:hypothetical protein
VQSCVSFDRAVVRLLVCGFVSACYLLVVYEVQSDCRKPHNLIIIHLVLQSIADPLLSYRIEMSCNTSTNWMSMNKEHVILFQTYHENNNNNTHKNQ